jgi:gliding motility-associated-like protein
MIFDEFIRKNLDSIEFPYDHNNWLKLEKDLPGNNYFNRNWKKIATIAGTTVFIAVTAFYVFYNSDKKVNSEKTTVNTISNTNESKKFNNKNLNTSSESKNINIIRNLSVSDIKINSSEIKQTSEKVIIKTGFENSSDINNSKVIENYAINIEPHTVVGPNSSFDINVNEGCNPMEVKFIPVQMSDTIMYLWNFGDGKTSGSISPGHTYINPGNYNVSLTVTYKKSNLKDTKEINNAIKVKQSPIAMFDNTGLPDNRYYFKNNSLNSNKYKWYIGKEYTEDENPENAFNVNGIYNVKLIAFNLNGCSDTASKNIDVVIKHNIQIGNAFSPDGDGHNDTFGPGVVDFLKYNYHFLIYNKSGQVIFESSDLSNQWDGHINNTQQDAEKGKYFWKIFGKDKFGNPYEQHGDVTILK